VAFGWVHRAAVALRSKKGLDAAGVRRRYRGLIGAIARHQESCGGLQDAFAHFRKVTRSYWPGLPNGSLVPDYCGIRPKLTGPGEPAADFVVAGPAEHGLPGLVALFGIESPGLTSSLSLAEAVVTGLVR